MAQQIINVGILENDQTGDTLRDAFIKINTNFTDLYVSSITLSGFSVGAEDTPSGNGGLAYDNTTGTFTYTPPTAAGLGALTDLTGTNFTTLADVTSVQRQIIIRYYIMIMGLVPSNGRPSLMLMILQFLV